MSNWRGRSEPCPNLTSYLVVAVAVVCPPTLCLGRLARVPLGYVHCLHKRKVDRGARRCTTIVQAILTTRHALGLPTAAAPVCPNNVALLKQRV